MITLHITETGKGYHPSSEWQLLHEYERGFDTREQAEAWIAETYGKSKRAKMYTERKGQPDIVCGYVIGFRNADLSHYPVDKWLQQDWIQFRESKVLDLAA